MTHKSVGRRSARRPTIFPSRQANLVGQALHSPVQKPQKNCCHEQNKIEGKMPGKAEILTGVTETTTGNIETSHFGDDTRDDEDGNQRV